MTSPLATNFVNVFKTKNHLQVDKDGLPLQGQVPLTQQIYSGTGNETITLQGKNILLIASAALSAGDLIVSIANAAAARNLINRKISVAVPLVFTNDIVIDASSSSLFFVSAANGTGQTCTIVAGTVGMVNITFVTEELAIVETDATNLEVTIA